MIVVLCFVVRIVVLMAQVMLTTRLVDDDYDVEGNVDDFDTVFRRRC